MNKPQKLEALAKTGIKYSHQIDQMLIELRHEFKALEPDYAAIFEKTLGSEKLATH